MKQRIITGILFTMVILAFVIPGYYFRWITIALTILVSIITAYEMGKTLEAKGIRYARSLLYIGASFSFIPVFLFPLVDTAYTVFTVYALFSLMYSMISIILPALFHASDGRITDGVASSVSALYISFPMACANTMLLFVRDGWLFFALGLFSPWISDVFAYFTGVFLGKHKIVPHISPKKTWEGCVGGAVGTAAIVAVFFSIVIFPNFESRLSFSGFLIASVCVGILLSVVSQFGDWTASAIKRWAGIKDFGSMLPGHGGLLDRFDSAFFTLPVAFVFGLLLV
ncbi:MAG: CDP-archaeol synthase [Clostridiaceae bacterium]|mgnify:FL=1|nr:CDP-archaeol synthase [Clostridiaceae bacterium]